MARTNTKRVIRKVRIFVGEGAVEKTFLLYLRSLYGCKAVRVTPKSAGGKGPDNVIGDAIAEYNQHNGNNDVAVLLDKDLPWPREKIKEANKHNITLIGIDPCIEALFIDILSLKRPVPCNNNTCKKLMHPKLKNKPTEVRNYSIFTKEILENKRKEINELNNIIILFEQ